VFGCPASPNIACRKGAEGAAPGGREDGRQRADQGEDRQALPRHAARRFRQPGERTDRLRRLPVRRHGARIATIRIPRTQQTCGTKPCWKASGSTGVKYTDKTLSSDGALQLQLKGGEPTKGKVQFKAKNNGPKGQLEMPTGLTLQLANDIKATVQVWISNGTCFSGTVTNIRENSAVQFKATEP
jgi:hypothetical protein